MLFLINITKVLLLLSFLLSSIIYQLVYKSQKSVGCTILSIYLSLISKSYCFWINVNYCMLVFVYLYNTRQIVQVYTNYQFYLLLGIHLMIWWNMWCTSISDYIHGPWSFECKNILDILKLDQLHLSKFSVVTYSISTFWAHKKKTPHKEINL